MGGAAVMILGMDIAGTAAGDLRDCGDVVRFFAMVGDLYGMEPHDELAHGGTKYVLASPGTRYIAYAPDATGQIGLKQMKAGRYSFLWFDCITGMTVSQESVDVAEGDGLWRQPSRIGAEAAVYIKRANE